MIKHLIPDLDGPLQKALSLRASISNHFLKLSLNHLKAIKDLQHGRFGKLWVSLISILKKKNKLKNLNNLK